MHILKIFIMFLFCSVFLYYLACFIFSPIRGFFREMPKDILKKGKFRPFTYKILLMKDGPKSYSKHYYKILLFAYLKARYMAWQLDFKTLGSEFGIAWGIEKEGRYYI